jgi:hypothetical protein
MYSVSWILTVCSGYRQFWHCALTTCSLPWMQVVLLATGSRYRDSHLFRDTQTVCRGYTHCVSVRGRVFRIHRIQGVCSGYRLRALDTGSVPTKQTICTEYTTQAMCHEQAMPEILAVRPGYRQCVRDTGSAHYTQAVCPGYKQCVLYTGSVSWIQTVCPGYRQCVLDTGSVSWIQAVSPEYRQCVLDTGSV